MSKFQIILLCVFGFFIVIAVAVFALYRGGSASNAATVTIWGDISTQDFSLLLNNATLSQDRTLTIQYVEKPTNSLEAEWTEALAAGVGPDLVILPQDKFWKNKNKLIPIPYESISQRDFQETFVEAGEVYLTADGIYGLPLTIDPLVLYYNRDLLSAAGVAKPLAYWDEIYNATLNLSKRDAAGNLVKSTIALGETRNINHAKDILALLLLQAGTPITGFVGTELKSALTTRIDTSTIPADSALEFYTQFSNPTKPFYSWNRTLPEAQTRFTSGDSAYYLGFASELSALRNKNPTLNFGVTSVPQSRVSGKTVTIGHLYGISISRGTLNPSAALTAAWKLISVDSAAALSQILTLPPARRDLLSERPTDAILPIFYNAALQSKSWLDPDAVGTEEIFNSMIDSVTSGRARVSEAAMQANNELDNLIN